MVMTALPTRLRKAWRIRIKGYDDAAHVFAPTAGRARMDLWRSMDSDIRIVDISVWREPHRDVRLPARDPIADTLSVDEQHCLLHAFGADQGDPTKAGYRDYFYTTRDDPPLVALTERGLMAPMAGETWGEGMTYFVLTKAGKHVALSMVPEYAR
jgi:hypothetical protein